MKKFKRKTVPLRVMVINGHIGIPIRHGAIQWIFRDGKSPHIILAQEIRESEVLRAALGDRWEITPFDQPGARRDNEAMTYVCFRSKRFRLLRTANHDITHGEQYPRRMTAATVLDSRARRFITAASVHCQPLGNGLAAAHPKARRRQTKQLWAYASFLGVMPSTHILLAGGDFNQNLSHEVPHKLREHDAHEIFGEVGLKAASSHVKGGKLGLMELFTSSNVTVKKRRTVNVPVQGMDHEVVLVNLRVKRD